MTTHKSKDVEVGEQEEKQKQKNKKKSSTSSKQQSSNNPKESEQRGHRFKATLEQLLNEHNRGRRETRRSINKTSQLISAVRKANRRQQANRTHLNLRRLLLTDRGTKLSKPTIKSVLSLSGRRLRKRREPKWRIKKEDKLHEVPKW